MSCRPFLVVGLWLLAGAAVDADSGLDFLRLGAGARAAAMAEATTAVVGPQSASLNPAALSRRRSTALSHTEWVGDVRHEHAATTWSRGADQVLAVDVRLAHAGQLERRVGPSQDPLGDFGVYEWTAGAAWSRALRSDLRLGLGAKYVRQSIDAEAAAGVAADLGLLYGDGPWWLGAALRNLGAMNELDREATDLPVQARLGLALERGSLLASLDTDVTRGADAGLHLGAEYRLRPRLLLRGGYQTSDTRHLSLGLGVVTGPWRVDYAFVPFGEGLGEAHRVSLIWMGT